MLNRVQHDAFCNSNPTPDWRGAGVLAPLSVAARQWSRKAEPRKAGKANGSARFAKETFAPQLAFRPNSRKNWLCCESLFVHAV